MFNPSHDAEKRMQSLARDTADQFDATLLHNRVSEEVSGQWNKDNDLIRLLDLAERAYHLSEDRRGDDDVVTATEVFAAAEDLNDLVDRLVDERVAVACAAIVTEADGWTDAWDEADIVDAQIEAKEWLGDNLGAAERAGVYEAVVEHV
jgi:hypothetical protein